MPMSDSLNFEYVLIDYREEKANDLLHEISNWRE